MAGVKNYLAFIVGMLFSLTLLISCNSQQSDRELIVPTVNVIKTDSVIHLPPMDWYIVDREELVRLYEENGQRIPPGGQLEGISGIVNGRNAVITTAPKYVDDEVTLTLGHEVMHVAFGKYHQPVVQP